MGLLDTRKYSPELPEVFSEKMAEYFIEDNMPWLVTDLCVHLHICTDTLLEYSKIPQFSASIKMAKLLIENYNAKQLFREANVTGIIFNLKNNFGWKDTQQVESKNINLNQDITTLTTEERRKRIAELKEKLGE